MTLDLDEDLIVDLRRALLAWYARERRDLPWRRRPDPYGVWVAEVMLQQTTVKAATPYWRRFLARWPDLAALAAAPEQEVLALWSGLGYYRRARALHRAARELAAAGGRLPRTFGQWLALPGIGRYTAGAIASIAGGQAVPAVDANARRVLLRWVCATPAAARAVGPAALEGLAARLVDPGAPGDWNQALMELGSQVCLPAAPRCGACPVLRLCAAGRAGRAAGIAGPAARRPARPVILSLLVIRAGDGILLAPAGETFAAAPALGEPARRGPDGLFAGLWSPPATPWYRDGNPADGRAGEPGRVPAAPGAATFRAAWSDWLHGPGRPAPEVLALGEVRHAVTTWRLRVVVCGAVVATRAPALPGWRWHRPERDPEPPLSALARKALARALQRDGRGGGAGRGLGSRGNPR